MASYCLSIFSAALAGALIGILSPCGGLSKYLRLIISCFLLCTLLWPLPSLLSRFLEDPSTLLPDLPKADPEEYESLWDGALQENAKDYFTQMLTQTLCCELSIEEGNLRCRVLWDETDPEAILPLRVTVILRGSAIWKDPEPIKDLVKALLNCECAVAIER